MKSKLLRITTMAVLLLAAMAMGQAQNVPITLNQGWNWISYPYSVPMSIDEALAGFTPTAGDVITSQTDGSVTYLNGRWRGTLTTLVPGKGYMYKSVDGTTRSFIFGGAAYDPSALPEAALDGEFTVDANGTKVRFSPGNLQCRVDPIKASQIQVGAGTSTTNYTPYNTYYNYSLCQMIYTAEELHAAGLSAGPITGIAFESYSSNHYQREGIEIWMASTTLTSTSSTSVSTSGMTKVFSGSVTQQTGWTEMAFTMPYVWNGTSNLIVTIAMNHGSWTSNTPWRCNSPGFTCSCYKYNDDDAYNPSTTYTMSTSTYRPNTRFNGRGGVTWRFAENQWDVVGEGNANISESYTGWIDLFGWGTSGHPHGANCYQPWSTSTTTSDYHAYGDASYNLFDQTGEADWGCNAISNGGDKPNQWRTLTKEEWTYVVHTRTTSSGKRYAKATVNGVSGLILLPDNWNTSYYTLNNTNTASAAFTSNTISASQWPTLEQHGAVFLPSAGWRTDGTSFNSNGGNYWSSSRCNGSQVYAYVFTANNAFSGTTAHYTGRSVRLVCQSNPRIRTIGMSGVTTTTATVNAEVDCTGSATVTERGVCFNTMAAPTVDNSFETAGTGTGSFSVQLTNLGAGTTYHVRAYAKIGGTYIYGNELTFTAKSQLVVTTAPVTDISNTYALCGGTVSDCGQNVTARGLCWGTSDTPTLSDSHSHSCEGTGTGSFTSFMGKLVWGATYYVRAYATTADGTTYGNVRSFLALDPNSYVDLGLPSGLLWATCNVGANAPEEYGDYFAWGETQPKDTYNWSTYQYCMDDSDMLTKYCNNSSYGYNGFTDNLTTLLPEDDAAAANWGIGWRMPTKEEFEELDNNTTWTSTTQNGVNGCLFTASNGNSLFLPAAGCRYYSDLDDAGSWGYYWSSSLDTDDPDYAWSSNFESGMWGMWSYYRFFGFTVRPVREN